MSQGSSPQPPPLKLENWQKQQFEKRIQELEKDRDEAREVEANSQKWIEMLEQRIVKAREILLTGIDGYAGPIIRRALDALEGK